MKNIKEHAHLAGTVMQQSAAFTWDDAKNIINAAVLVITFLCNKYVELSGISHEVLKWLVILLIANSVSGLVRSVKFNDYSRKKLYGGMFMKIMLLVVPIVLKGVSTIVGAEAAVIYYAYCGILAVHEAESFFSNIYSIRTGKVLPEKDIISQLIKACYTGLDKIRERLVGKISNPTEDNKEGEK